MTICTIIENCDAKDDLCLIPELNYSSPVLPPSGALHENPARKAPSSGALILFCVAAFSLGFLLPSLLWGWPEFVIPRSRPMVSFVTVVEGDLHLSLSSVGVVTTKQVDSTEASLEQAQSDETSEATSEETPAAYGTLEYCRREFPETFDTCRKLCRYGSDGCFNEGFCMCAPSTDRQPALKVEMLVRAEARCFDSDSDHCSRYCREYKLVNGDTGYDWVFDGGKKCKIDSMSACVCF